MATSQPTATTNQLPETPKTSGRAMESKLSSYPLSSTPIPKGESAFASVMPENMILTVANFHIATGVTQQRGRRSKARIPQMHVQRQAHLRQQQQPNNLVPFCYAFQKGQCTRGQTCRFAHELQRPQRQQHQQAMQRPADLPPSRACRNVWATSTCDNWNCKFEHGSFDARGEPCKNFLTRSHCPYIFSSVGCKFSHAREQNANQVPLGGARTQRELLSKATPDQKDH